MCCGLSPNAITSTKHSVPPPCRSCGFLTVSVPCSVRVWYGSGGGKYMSKTYSHLAEQHFRTEPKKPLIDILTRYCCDRRRTSYSLHFFMWHASTREPRVKCQNAHNYHPNDALLCGCKDVVGRMLMLCLR